MSASVTIERVEEFHNLLIAYATGPLQMLPGRMAVIISHRFSTVRMADRIVFLMKAALWRKVHMTV